MRLNVQTTPQRDHAGYACRCICMHLSNVLQYMRTRWIGMLAVSMKNKLHKNKELQVIYGDCFGKKVYWSQEAPGSAWLSSAVGFGVSSAGRDIVQ